MESYILQTILVVDTLIPVVEQLIPALFARIFSNTNRKAIVFSRGLLIDFW